MINQLAKKYGVHDPHSRRVGRPSLSRKERAYVNKLKRKYSELLTTITKSRHELLAAAAGQDTRFLVARLAEEGHEMTAMALVLNNEQIAVLLEFTSRQAENGSGLVDSSTVADAGIPALNLLSGE